MKVISPSPALREAADVLAPVREEVVVIGALALQTVLAETPALLTPTVDVDCVVEAPRAESVVNALVRARLRRSDLVHERRFTWVRGPLKVQLLRPFHPFPKGVAAGLPENPGVVVAIDVRHREQLAFDDDPVSPRVWMVTPACLVALKELAFGRADHDGVPVERDYHDVYLVMRYAADALHASYLQAGGDVKGRVTRAADRLAAGEEETRAAGRQLLRVEGQGTQRAAELEVARVATAFVRRLG